jgi:hypothetical protein
MRRSAGGAPAAVKRRAVEQANKIKNPPNIEKITIAL